MRLVLVVQGTQCTFYCDCQRQMFGELEAVKLRALGPSVLLFANCESAEMPGICVRVSDL